jgi:LmbE family N-acetylglucosaminyl deacetylase
VKIVVLSPHRNDAAFSLGLAIEAWIAQGHAIEVINCFTRSGHAPFSDAESLHPNDRLSYATAVRLREDQAWSRPYGKRLRLTDLNLKDAPIRFRYTAEEIDTVPVNPADKAIDKIRKALEKAQPDALLIPFALGNDVDHRTVRHAALLDPVITPVFAFYEDLPYALRPGIGEGMEAAANSLNLDLHPAFAAPLGDEATAIQRKRKLALNYDSQIDDAVTEEIANFTTRYQGRERLWANAAWRASQLASQPS